MTRLWPCVGAAVGFLTGGSVAGVPRWTATVGLVYAAWPGWALLERVVLGSWVFGERLPRPAWIGVGLVIAGVVLLGVYAPNESDVEKAGEELTGPEE